MHDPIESQIRTFVLHDLLRRDDDARLPPGAPLLSGLIDSLGLEELFDFLEERFGIRVRSGHVTEEHFGSVESLAAYVRSRLTVGQAAGAGPPGAGAQ